MQTPVFHLEKLPAFVHRAVELNRLHAPEDPRHEQILEGADGEAAATRRTLQAIHRSFPEQAPLHVQAAYLVRAFSGLRPFAEANHRTGWDVMAETMMHAGHEILATPQEVRELGSELWDRLDGMQEKDLRAADNDLDYLAAWFRTRIA